MNKQAQLKACVAIASLLGLPMAQAATLTKAEYDAGKTHLSAAYKASHAACAVLAGNAKDICVQQAKGKEKVARAELEFGYTAKPAEYNKVLVAKAESAYALAKEKCDDSAGNVKDVCLKEAKAIEVKALANAKLGQEIGAAQRDAAAVKRDADYDLAAQKCDSLAGDTKAACIAAAKAAFGKS